MSGYVRLHRDLLAHPAFRNDAEALAFAWMFARAAWKDCRVRYKGKPITLRRGQLAISIRDMATALDRDKAWVERLFKRLRGETMIETASEAGVSVVTILNYDKYQPRKDDDETAGETPNETDARQTRDTEQIREEVKKEEDPPKPPRKRRGEGKHLLPKDWALPAVADLPPKARGCAELWTAESYATHGEAFALYWRSEGKMKTDWLATWANRVIDLHSKVLRDQKFGNAPNAVAAQSGPKRPANPIAYAKWCEQQADNYERIGQDHEAQRLRKQAAQLRGTGPPKQIGDLVGSVIRRVGNG